MIFRKVEQHDVSRLSNYLEGLSNETRRRFGPHPFDPETVSANCNGKFEDYTSYAGLKADKEIIAYAVLKKGYLDFELPRFSNYQLILGHERDYTLAPSVADDYQSQGVGSMMMEYICNELKSNGADKIILWGGVQESNKIARRYYRKFGFQVLGQFDTDVSNLDMVKSQISGLVADEKIVVDGNNIALVPI